MKRFFESINSVGPLVGRLVLAGVMLPHGLQKVFGWFGGNGFQATMNSFTEQMGIPAFMAFIAILNEFAVPLLLIVGLFTRLAALALGAHILVAAVLGGHFQHGFFMNWLGNQSGQGVEYHFLMAGLAAVIMIEGAGRLAIDNVIARRMAHTRTDEEIHGRTAPAH